MLTELTRPLTSFLATVHGDRRFALTLLAVAGFFVVVAWGIVIWVFFRINRGRRVQACLAAGLRLAAPWAFQANGPLYELLTTGRPIPPWPGVRGNTPWISSIVGP